MKYRRFLNMTLTPVTLTFDLVRSLLGSSLMHLPSLDKIGPGVFEISKIFEYDLDPSDLDLWPRGVNSWTKPDAYTKFGWNRAKGLRDIEIWPLTPVTLTLKKITPSDTSGSNSYMCTKFGDNRPKGLGGVNGQTDRQTNRQTDKLFSNYSMMKNLSEHIL